MLGNVPAMKTESMGRVTWFANAHSMLEPGIRNLEQNLWGAPTREGLRPQGTQAGGLESTEGNHAGVIIVPVDFSPTSLEAVRVGASVARHTQAKLVLCHAISPNARPHGRYVPPLSNEALRGEAAKDMEPTMNLAKEAGVKVECVIEEGAPAQVILNLARRYDADLIILAPREHGPWARAFFGPSTAERVTQEAEGHVIVLRAARK